MLVLAVDTSSAAVTAAVAEVEEHEVRLVSERVTVNARAHGELLAPLISDCLCEARSAPGDLRAVVAGAGPGPFTGLRVGLVTAAVIGQTLAIATYGVCSLDAIAAGLLHDGLIAADARRREVYWARYQGGRRVAGPEVAHPTDVPAWDGPMAGAGARLYADELGAELLDRDYPSALGLVRLAADRVRSQAPSEALTPLYLRRPDAVPPTRFKAVT